jgi:DNA-binding NarL/FixJ family response regulator
VGATVRVLIVDDHMLFAEAIRVALEDFGMTVGVETNGEDALAALERSIPDVILMDIGLPDRTGLVVGKLILDRWPDAKILALTALNDRAVLEEALHIGFRGYLTKDTPVAQFVNSIRSVLDGHLVLPQRLSPLGRRPARDDGVALMTDQLSRREREVLSLLVQGANGGAVAERLGISRNTVRTHVQSILTKLQVHSRLEAAAFAVRHGLVDVSRDAADQGAARSFDRA